MRREAAFRFIPELLGDINHVMELSKNPKRLYVEVAVDSLHAGVKTITAFIEHSNTKHKKDTLKALQKQYEDLGQKSIDNYIEEAVRKIDIDYEQIKANIAKMQFRSSEIRAFIDCLSNELRRVIDILTVIQADPDYPDRADVEETLRKTMRTHQKLLTLHIEEGQKDG